MKKFNLRENVSYTLKDKNGKVKPIFKRNWLGRLLNVNIGHYVEKLVISNLVVSAGKAGVASRINGAGSESAFTYIAIGTGTNAASAGDTALQTEITTGGGARAAATCTRVTTDTTNDTAKLSKTFTFTSSFAVTESGVFNASSGGTLLARQVFSAINVESGDSITIEWEFDVD